LREAKKIRDDVIRELEEKLKAYSRNIADLNTEVLQLQGRVHAAPSVHRVPEIEKMSFVYQ
jgi:hypothetical protein